MEVLLSIAILGGAIATIGELIRVGTVSAARSRDLTTAQMIAETKMSEIASAIFPLAPVNQTQYEYDPDFLYSVQIQEIDQNGLTSVSILVEKHEAESSRPIQYVLHRWMLESDIQLIQDAASGITDTSTGGSGSTGGSSSGGASGGAR